MFKAMIADNRGQALKHPRPQTVVFAYWGWRTVFSTPPTKKIRILRRKADV